MKCFLYVLILGFSSAAMASEDAFFGFSIGNLSTNYQDGVDNDAENVTGLLLGAEIGKLYKIDSNFTASLDGFFDINLGNEIKSDDQTTTLRQQSKIGVKFRGIFNISESWNFYGALGLGFSAYNIKLKNHLEGIYLINGERTTYTKMVRFGLGTEIKLKQNFNIFGELHYDTTPSSNISVGRATFSISSHNVGVRIGTRYFF